MIKKLIRCVVAAVVLWLIYLALTWIVSLSGLVFAHVAVVIIAVILVLILAGFIAHEFGLWSGDL